MRSFVIINTFKFVLTYFVVVDVCGGSVLLNFLSFLSPRNFKYLFLVRTTLVSTTFYFTAVSWGPFLMSFFVILLLGFDVIKMFLPTYLVMLYTANAMKDISLVVWSSLRVEFWFLVLEKWVEVRKVRWFVQLEAMWVRGCCSCTV